METAMSIAMKDMGKLIAAANSPQSEIDELRGEFDALQAETVTGVYNIVTGYGADPTGATFSDLAFNNAVNAAVAAGGGIVECPPGTFNFSIYPSSLRQETITETKDLKNIIIRGAGKATILKGVSADGHDVLQLNGVKNLTIKDLAITSIKTSPADMSHGCNGISVTNGTNNVTIDNVYAYDLPYVVKPTYVDGGKPFTVQPGALGVEACHNINVINCESDNCPFGFEASMTGTEPYQPYGINVIMNTFKAFYRILSIGASAPASGNFNEKLMFNVVDNIGIGAQQALALTRVSGMFENNQFYSDLTAIPTAISIDTAVVPIGVVSCEHAVVKDNFVYYARCDHYARVGGTGSGATKFCSFKDNQFTGASDGAGFLAIDFGGNTVRNSVFANNQFRGVTTVAYDEKYYESANDNVIVTNGAGTRFEKLGIGTTGDISGADFVINGMLGFTYSDGKSATNFIFRNGIPIAVKQTISSGATTKVFQVLSNADAELFNIDNSGHILTNQVTTAAVPGTQTKRLPIYDVAGTLMGYIPIYST
ncbi:hypothetical protein [Cohnella panacarvi]|uniref:hypothetical protein n=1 Tax=Cohnella panacarvi TaxID=400776 RepID=UPI00047CB4A0|nr:hypothetical protein [Cohnella panacarvi]